jgi:hypothetical protein
MRWNTRAAATVSGIRRIARNRQFENDRSPVSTIVKGVKRAMACEYSREFSAKVFNGQSRLIELGFRQGGPAGYGGSFCALQVLLSWAACGLIANGKEREQHDYPSDAPAEITDQVSSDDAAPNANSQRPMEA